MPDIEDEIIATAHTIKSLLDKLHQYAREKRNEKVQQSIKNLLEGFTNELKNGSHSKDELKAILKSQKDEIINLKKDMGIDEDKKIDQVIKRASDKVKSRGEIDKNHKHERGRGR